MEDVGVPDFRGRQKGFFVVFNGEPRRAEVVAGVKIEIGGEGVLASLLVGVGDVCLWRISGRWW